MNLKRQSWSLVVQAPAGGSILQITSDGKGQIWAASPAGLFHRKKETWRAAVNGLPFVQTGAVACVPGLENRPPLLLAAGLDGGVARSLDGGGTWQSCWIEQSKAPVGCFAASPNFSRDGVLLAGTQGGDGVLRSTDGGRFWNLSNFGLRNFEIYALVTAGEWGWRETAYAGTADGVYVSPNGGRAWKFCGLPGKAVLSLAANAAFGEKPTLFAGTEGEGLWRSADAGKTWQQVAPGNPETPHSAGGAPGASCSVNALWWREDNHLLAATSELGVLCSSDGGENWRQADGPQTVLCLSGQGDQVYAGAVDEGLWRSQDGGNSWQLDGDLAARRFQRLAAVAKRVGENAPPSLPARPPTFLAGGVGEGLWLAEMESGAWQRLGLWSEDAQVLSLAGRAGAAWVGASDGVWMADLAGVEPGTGDGLQASPVWRKMLDSDGAIVALAFDDRQPRRIWAGEADGNIWFSADEGANWAACPSPGGAKSLLTLEASPDGAELLAAVYGDAPSGNEAQIWRARLAETDGKVLDWELFFAEKTSWRMARLACGGVSGKQWVIGLGSTLIDHSAEGWQRYDPAATWQAPIQEVTWLVDERKWVVVTAEALLVSADLQNWQTVESVPPGIAALLVPAQDAGDNIFALTIEGNLWRWH